MITFNDWVIQNVGYPLAMQYDNATRDLYISGDIPDGYTWDVLCRYKRELNIIRLSAVDGGIGATLTKHDLSNSGTYILQLRGTNGTAVRHSNAIQVEIPKSLSGDEQWPFIPSEFSQMEARINKIAENAEELNQHPPIPDSSGYWKLWNLETGEYEISDIPVETDGLVTVSMLENGEVDLHPATETLVGGLKSSETINTITVAEDGVASVNDIGVSKLENDGVILVLNGGRAPEAG